MRVKFYVDGSKRKGEAHLDLKKVLVPIIIITVSIQCIWMSNDETLNCLGYLGLKGYTILCNLCMRSFLCIYRVKRPLRTMTKFEIL